MAKVEQYTYKDTGEKVCVYPECQHYKQTDIKKYRPNGYCQHKGDGHGKWCSTLIWFNECPLDTHKELHP